MAIHTVTGYIHSDELGFCQCHEHLWIARGQSALVNPDICVDDHESSLAELRQYRKAGGAALVDAQPVGCGRDPLQLESLSRESGVAIIASTGFHRALYYPDGHWLFSCDADWLTRLFIRELHRGMYLSCDWERPAKQTKIRAGQIKTALDSGPLDPLAQKLFGAACDASMATGAPIMVHIQQGADPIALSDLFFRQDVPLERVIFCHMDRSVPDLGIHKELCARGIYLEYDTVGRHKYHSDEREAEIVLELLDAGYKDQLLFSLDVTRARMLSYGGEIGLCYILETFLPLLRQRGVGQNVIHSFFYDNPARVYDSAD